MVSRDEERKARRARQLHLPIISFDHRLTMSLRDSGVEVEDDGDVSELDEHVAQQNVILFDYMVSEGLAAED